MNLRMYQNCDAVFSFIQLSLQPESTEDKWWSGTYCFLSASDTLLHPTLSLLHFPFRRLPIIVELTL